jgi:hypothetical protein
LEFYALVLKILGKQVQELEVEVSETGVTLRGFCDSFQIKQVAQEIVSRNSSRRIVSNLISVR